MADVISDVDEIPVEEYQPSPDLLHGEDTPEVDYTQSASHKFSSLGSAANKTVYGNTENPFEAFASSLEQTPGEHDAEAGQMVITSVSEELGPDAPDASEVMAKAYEDTITPGISDRAGFEVIVPEPQILHNRKKLVSYIDQVKAENPDGWGQAWEMAKSMFIPGRSMFAAKALFDTWDLDKVENFTNSYKAAPPEKQEELLDLFLARAEKVDGYWLEKTELMSNLIENTSDENLGMMKFFAYTDIVMGAGDLIGIASVARKLAQKSDIAIAVKEAGNPKLGGEIAARAVTGGPDVAKTLGVDYDATVASVIRNDGVHDANDILGSMPGANLIDPKVAAFRQSVDDSLTEAKDSLLPATFQEDDRLREIDRINKEAIAEVEARYAPEAQAQVKVNSTMNEDGELVVDISYDYYDKFKKDGTADLGTKKKQGTETKRITVTKTAWGMLDQFGAEDIAQSGLNPASAKRKLRNSMESTTVGRVVEDAGLVQNALPKFENTFAEAYSVAFKEAGGKKKRAGVVKALAEQDKVGKVMSKEELLTFDPTLDSKQVASYFMVNELQDVARVAAGDMRFRRGQLEGLKEIDLGGTSLGFGKTFDDLGENFLKAMDNTYLSRNNLPKAITDISTGKAIKMSDVPAYLKSRGYKVAVLDKDEVLPDGLKHQVVITPSTGVTPLRRESLDIHRVDGYVPRIRSDAKYFVDHVVTDMVNGKKVDRVRTAVGASTKKEAEQIRAQMADDLANGTLTDAKGNKLTDVKEVSKVRYDREGLNSGANDDIPLDKRGVFIGHRSTHDIEWRGHAATLDAPDVAIAKNMAFLARQMPMNEWRMRVETQWKNAVRESGLDPQPSLDKPVVGDSRLEESRRYISSMIGIPDQDTLSWEKFTRHLSEKIDNVAPRTARAIRRNTKAHPADTLKYAAFQSLLGWFNPSQLIVQAMNMTTAMSIHPWISTTHLHKMMAVRATLYADDAGSIKLLAGKIPGIDADELADVVRQFKRANIDQVQTNADVSAAAAGYGTTRRAFQKAADSGLIFYRQGELAGRTVNYVVAREAYMRKKGIKSWKNLKDDDHREIKEYFDNLSINLGRENKANFQSGFSSIPTQFWHVQTKFMEMFLGKKFDSKEKMRLLLGQGVLFGAAGIPLGSYIAEKWAGMFRGEDGGYEGPISEDVVRGGLVNWLSGDADVASRGGIPNALTDQLLSIFKETNDPMWEKIMGASGTLIGRVGYAANIINPFGPTAPSDVDEVALLRVMRATASIASSFNNLEQAYMMNKTQKFISKTSGMINYNNPTFGEVLSKGLGFQTKREKVMYEGILDVKGLEKWRLKMADKFFQQQFAKGLDVRSIEFSEQWQEDMVAWTNYYGDTDHDRAELQSAIMNRLYDLSDKETKADKAILKHQLSSQINAMLVGEALEPYKGED